MTLNKKYSKEKYTVTKQTNTNIIQNIKYNNETW
jgi:hypothetical protein